MQSYKMFRCLFSLAAMQHLILATALLNFFLAMLRHSQHWVMEKNHALDSVKKFTPTSSKTANFSATFTRVLLWSKPDHNQDSGR